MLCLETESKPKYFDWFVFFLDADNVFDVVLSNSYEELVQRYVVSFCYDWTFQIIVEGVST